jgi:hypothetical protein
MCDTGVLKSLCVCVSTRVGPCRQYTPAVWRPKAAASTQTEPTDVAVAAEMLEALQLQGGEQEAQAPLGASPDPNQQYSSNPFAVSHEGCRRLSRPAAVTPATVAGTAAVLVLL